jgi:hypothetical protein
MADQDEIIEALLFKQAERPKGLFAVKIINVFSDKYRINVWAKIEEDGLEKNKIASSYFVKFKNKKLEILYV